MDAVTRPPGTSAVINAMTVDVEDYFQVSAFEQHVDKAHWQTLPCRVEANTERILELFDAYQVRGTFFTLGWVAERYPGLVKNIIAGGHELASHGWEHIRVNTQTPREFRQDIERTRKLLEDITFQISKGDRIGLVGNNGIGKTTLLKIILGAISQDSGTIEKPTGLTIGYLSQQMKFTNVNRS